MGFKVYSNLSTTTHLDQKSGYVSETGEPYLNGYTYLKKLGNSSAKTSDGQTIMPVNDPTYWSWWTSQIRPWAVELAVGKFKEELHNRTTAALGIAIAQWDQTLGMAKKRLSVLGNFARKIPGASLVLVTGGYAARRQALRSLGRSLNIPSNNSDLRRLQKRSGEEWRRRLKTPGDLWLEFWFGWSASVADLSAAAKVLSDPRPLVRVVKGKVRKVWSKVVKNLGSHGTHHTDDVRLDVSAGVSGQVTVQNPNIYLANRLGLVNLAAVAWDAIPFSWVAGWFGNFQKFLEQLTWDAGLTIPQSTRYVGTRIELTMKRDGQWRLKSGQLTRVSGTATLYAKDRSKGWDGTVKIRLHAPRGNLTRCLSLGSVLLQKLSSFSTPLQYRRA